MRCVRACEVHRGNVLRVECCDHLRAAVWLCARFWGVRSGVALGYAYLLAAWLRPPSCRCVWAVFEGRLARGRSRLGEPRGCAAAALSAGHREGGGNRASV